MSRSAKKLKLDSTTRSITHRNESTLHSGQFMTSRIDDNEVNNFYLNFKTFIFEMILAY